MDLLRRRTGLAWVSAGTQNGRYSEGRDGGGLGGPGGGEVGSSGGPPISCILGVFRVRKTLFLVDK